MLAGLLLNIPIAGFPQERRPPERDEDEELMALITAIVTSGILDD